MEFLKRNLFLIVCSVLALAGIGLIVTGIQAMPKVSAAMNESKSLYESLNNLKPANQKAIDAEKKRIQTIVDDRNKVFADAAKLAPYEPLLPDVFPSGTPIKRLDFRTKYVVEVRKLLDSLNWGGLPTPAEIDATKDKIEDEKAAGTLPDQKAAEAEGKRVLQAEVGPRAAITKAQSIYLYAVPPEDEKLPERPASIQLAPAMKDTGSVEAPAIEDVWRAQIWYWIQRDIVNAIRSINEEAAKMLQERGERPWVGNMPVKEIISIRISEYVPKEGDMVKLDDPGDFKAARPPGSAQSVFTGTAASESFDVIQFAIKLVMDQRDIPLLIERLSNNTPHTLLRVAYKQQLPSKTMADKIHGSEPTVNVILEFETIMLGDVFRKLMPQEVCEKEGITCPTRDDAKKDEKDGD